MASVSPAGSATSPVLVRTLTPLREVTLEQKNMFVKKDGRLVGDDVVVMYLVFNTQKQMVEFINSHKGDLAGVKIEQLACVNPRSNRSCVQLTTLASALEKTTEVLLSIFPKFFEKFI